MNIPLAERMRPKKLADYCGQQHLIGPNGSFKQMIKSGVFPSIILWGPPGTGKTTLAQLLAFEKKCPFYHVSAVNAGVKEIRDIIQKSENSVDYSMKKLQFSLLMKYIGLANHSKTHY